MNLLIAIGSYPPAGDTISRETEILAQSLGHTHQVRVVTHLTDTDTEEQGIAGLTACNVSFPFDAGYIELEVLMPGRFGRRLLPLATHSLRVYDWIYGADFRAHARGAELIYAVPHEGELLHRLAQRVAGEMGVTLALRGPEDTIDTVTDRLLDLTTNGNSS